MTRECHVRFCERVVGQFPRSTHHFGMKVHTGTDADSGIVRTNQATAASVANVKVFAELLHGNEDSVHRDSAYHSKELKAQAEAAGIEFSVNEPGSKHAPLNRKQRARNRRLSRVRAIVEHPFLVVKRLWAHAKVRYRVIAKNLAQMYMLFGLANIYGVRYALMRTCGGCLRKTAKSEKRTRMDSDIPGDDLRIALASVHLGIHTTLRRSLQR